MFFNYCLGSVGLLFAGRCMYIFIRRSLFVLYEMFKPFSWLHAELFFEASAEIARIVNPTAYASSEIRTFFFSSMI